jgi:hypothetical protein
LVTVLRLLQVPHKVKEERDNPALGVAIGDNRRVDKSGEGSASGEGRASGASGEGSASGAAAEGPGSKD